MRFFYLSKFTLFDISQRLLTYKRLHRIKGYANGMRVMYDDNSQNTHETRRETNVKGRFEKGAVINGYHRPVTERPTDTQNAVYIIPDVAVRRRRKRWTKDVLVNW